jgi:hypothetical protein
VATLTVFEIHTQKNGKWKTDSVFDDRELAVVEAKRMVRNMRSEGVRVVYKGVRVVEEIYEDKVGKVSSRVIYRSTKKLKGGKGTGSEKGWIEQILEMHLLFLVVAVFGLGLVYVLNLFF